MSDLKILHVFPDDKFFDGISSLFDEIDGVINLYVFYTKNPNYKFKYTKSYSKIRFESDIKNYLSLFKDPNIDVIFYHSLSPTYYKYVKYTDEKKINIWWCWGYDIYSTGIVDIDIHMPLTLKVKNLIERTSTIKNRTKNYAKTLLNFIKLNFNFDMRSLRYRKALSKIDYVITVLPIEFDLISKNKYFKGFRFKERGSFRDYEDSMISNIISIETGNILFGNSASFDNNHVDILNIFENIYINNTIIMPLSYGNKRYAEILKNKSDSRYLILDSFLNNTEYEKIITSCSYAVFGHLRQSAMGNINLCLRNGLKVFLYEKSLIYKQLIKDGYIIYTIDFDLNEKELSNPLTSEQIKHNQNVYKSILGMNSFQNFCNLITAVKKPCTDFC